MHSNFHSFFRTFNCSYYFTRFISHNNHISSFYGSITTQATHGNADISEVTVVNEIAGNLIIQVKESRIALDKTMANRIMIG